MIPIFTALLVMAAAASTDARATPRQAACAAQAFLRANGYLSAPPTADTRELQLELWDGVKYSKNGKFDYEAMLRERRGLYSGRLQGVQSDDDGGFSVVYRLKGQGRHDRSCLRVTHDLRSVVVIDATCRPWRPVKRFTERRLTCRVEP